MSNCDIALNWQGLPLPVSTAARGMSDRPAEHAPFHMATSPCCHDELS